MAARPGTLDPGGSTVSRRRRRRPDPSLCRVQCQRVDLRRVRSGVPRSQSVDSAPRGARQACGRHHHHRARRRSRARGSLDLRGLGLRSLGEQSPRALAPARRGQGADDGRCCGRCCRCLQGPRNGRDVRHGGAIPGRCHASRLAPVTPRRRIELRDFCCARRHRTGRSASRPGILVATCGAGGRSARSLASRYRCRPRWSRVRLACSPGQGPRQRAPGIASPAHRRGDDGRPCGGEPRGLRHIADPRSRHRLDGVGRRRPDVVAHRAPLRTPHSRDRRDTRRRRGRRVVHPARHPRCGDGRVRR